MDKGEFGIKNYKGYANSIEEVREGMMKIIEFQGGIKMHRPLRRYYNQIKYFIQNCTILLEIFFSDNRLKENKN